MSIRIFVTAGTFDKEYDEITGNLFFKTTHIREMLELGRSKIGVNISTLMMKDSLDMSNNDRELILDNCMGVGSTGIAAKNTNRRFIGIEKNQYYFKKATENLIPTL